MYPPPNSHGNFLHRDEFLMTSFPASVVGWLGREVKSGNCLGLVLQSLQAEIFDCVQLSHSSTHFPEEWGFGFTSAFHFFMLPHPLYGVGRPL